MNPTKADYEAACGRIAEEAIDVHPVNHDRQEHRVKAVVNSNVWLTDYPCLILEYSTTKVVRPKLRNPNRQALAAVWHVAFETMVADSKYFLRAKRGEAQIRQVLTQREERADKEMRELRAEFDACRTRIERMQSRLAVLLNLQPTTQRMAVGGR